MDALFDRLEKVFCWLINFLAYIYSYRLITSKPAKPRQRYHQMRKILREFERHMDPQIAAALYNAKNSLLLRLPNEVLCRVMVHAAQDDLSFACLRQVSRLFRRLVNIPDFRSHQFSTWHECSTCNGEDVRCAKIWVKGSVWQYSLGVPRQTDLFIEMKDRLRRDRLCVPCSSEYVREVLARSAAPDDYLHCQGCGCDHLSSYFSAAEKAKPSKGRVCIGREGFVRVCAHQVVTWADIEQGLAQMKRIGRPDLSELDVKSCQHGAHVFCCTEKASPPRLQLQKIPGSGVLSAELLWTPHSSLTCLPTGKVSASEIRAMAQKYQADAGQFLVGEPIFGHYLPEMECFPASHCDCLHYDELQVDHIEKVLGVERGRLSDEEQPLLRRRRKFPSLNIQHWYLRPAGNERWTIQNTREKTAGFLSSKYGHYSVLALVSLDVLSMIADFILKLFKCEQGKSGPDWDLALDVLGSMSLAFSCLFMVELIASVWAFGWNYFNSWFHCFDAFIVIASFITDVVLVGIIEEIASLIVVMRLWRVTKIIEELSLGAQEQSGDLEREMDELRKENVEACETALNDIDCTRCRVATSLEEVASAITTIMSHVEPILSPPALRAIALITLLSLLQSLFGSPVSALFSHLVQWAKSQNPLDRNGFYSAVVDILLFLDSVVAYFRPVDEPAMINLKARLDELKAQLDALDKKLEEDKSSTKTKLATAKEDVDRLQQDTTARLGAVIRSIDRMEVNISALFRRTRNANTSKGKTE
ncbi:hypothetical protein QQZ08_000466 [Neonectria magnoliae]|uniref:Voltage-gated hydrogen channel 1 n=1 Tax=Neonectria magnoliae TaxID=2732573 RepID=A0ABR1IJ58_9HYPO